MRIALFGGTFDPVHTGHLLLAESARITHRLDRIVFIPTGVPPHKSMAIAKAAHRLRMLRLATASNPAFEVSDWEIRKKRVVYSYETIAHFRAQRPGGKLFFIVGTDMMKSLRQWKKGYALLEECVFLVAERPGISWRSLPAGVRRQSKQIQWPAVPFASHEIRGRVSRGQSVRYQVSDSVEKYIRAHRLYR